MAFKNITKIQCSQKLFQVQNDLRDWELDAQAKPVKVINEKYWKSKGISVDPTHIPLQKIELERRTIIDGKEVIEIIEFEKAIKDATLVIATPVDPIDPIVEVKP